MPAYKTYSSEQLQLLNSSIANSDEAAFTQLFLYFNDKLLAFALSMVHSKEVAEELVEDVFVRIWAKRTTLTTINNIQVYLYVAVKNACLNQISQHTKDIISTPSDFLETTLADLSDDPCQLMITVEMMAAMQKAVDDLPPRCKMIFKLIREDGLSYKEVAEILSISINTIDAQMAIAVKKISEALQVKKPRNFFSTYVFKNKFQKN